MLEIHRGTSQAIEFYVYDEDGNLTNADSNVTLKIYDQNSGSVLLNNASAVNNVPSGLYSFDLTPTYTSTDTTLKIEWSYAVNSSSVKQNQFLTVITPYATVSDIISFNGYGARPQDANYKSPEQITYAEMIARTQINNYTSLNFGKRYGSQELFGVGSDAVFLTERMISVDKMDANGVNVIDYTASPVYNNAGWNIELSPTGKAVRVVRENWDVRYDNQVDPTVLYYGQFRKNERYKFTGYIGYEYVPQEIKLCTMILAGDLLSQDAAWRNKYLTDIKLSETSFKIGAGAFNGTGNVIVDGILDQYRNVNIVVI